MSGKPLFDVGERTDRSLLRPGEDTMTFLNRVDDVYFGRVHDLLDSWYAEWPDERSARLRGDIRLGQQPQADGAFWDSICTARFVSTGARSWSNLERRPRRDPTSD